MTVELIAWGEAILLVIMAVAALYYRIGRGRKKDAEQKQQQVSPPSPQPEPGGNNRIGREEFIARVALCDRKFDRIHERLDEQNTTLGAIKGDTGYLRGVIDSTKK